MSKRSTHWTPRQTPPPPNGPGGEYAQSGPRQPPRREAMASYRGRRAGTPPNQQGRLRVPRARKHPRGGLLDPLPRLPGIRRGASIVT